MRPILKLGLALCTLAGSFLFQSGRKQIFMKKRKYIDLFGYTAEEFDNLLEISTNKILRSNGKPKSELDMQTVFTAYKEETRKLPRRRLREMRTTG